MGYSCTKAASCMLGLIRHTFTDGQTSNGLRIGAATFFYEIGRENADGSITGTVFENTGVGTCRKYGSFKIHAEGVIVRFPGVKQNQRVSLKFKFDELMRTNPMLLSSYSNGSI
jgi:hypothetical protein